MAYLFTLTGIIVFGEADEEQVMEVAIEAGAEDIVSNDDGSIEVNTTPDEFEAVRDAFIAAGMEPSHAEVTQVAATTVGLDAEQWETFSTLFDVLDDLDDVQNVYSNAEQA